MAERRAFFMVVLAVILVGAGLNINALATEVKSIQVPRLALDGASITKYSDPLPVFGPAGPNPRVQAGSALAVSYHEFQQKVLPDAFYTTLPSSITNLPSIPINPQNGTLVWGYKVGSAPQFYPGFTVESQQGTPTQVTYTNYLGDSSSNFPLLQRYITVDQTIHWANPLGLPMGDPARFAPYSGPQPVVPHLHGGEVRSDSDGGPEQWWTPGGEGSSLNPPAMGAKRGPGYYPNGNVYTYPNVQEATTLWFHDHTLGATRTNVYAGLAAFWFLRDWYDNGKVNTGVTPPENPSNLPAGPQEVEIVFQDRQFDVEGQWLFPDGYPGGLNGPPTNPFVHPYWNPEFFGDVIVVNGKSWPYFEVEPRRYRLRLLNGSNARFYELRLENRGVVPATAGPGIYVIGSDGGLLDGPALTSSTPTNRLIMAPGERYDVIIDFAAFNTKTLTVVNSANAPYPGGAAPDPATTEELMQFRVVKPLVGPTDTSYDPSGFAALRGGEDQLPAIVRLSNGTGGINPAVTVNKKRQLTLREVMGPGGPLEVLVNNTKWDGMRAGTMMPIPDSQKLGPNWLTELPQVGSTEVWEIINLTGDAHPIHLHLIQFQLVNRQTYNDVAYTAAYDAAFPGGLPIDAYGPPLDYNSTGTPGNPNYTGFYGGNPDVKSFLTAGTLTPPLPQETGWKDTVIMYPGQVTRIIARWAPLEVPVGGVQPAQNLYPFDPTYGPGYVWHCHIIDHEDNEMMRPYIPTKNADNKYVHYGAETAAINLLLLD
jgi:spore coat protein A, manganese oxidase